MSERRVWAHNAGLLVNTPARQVLTQVLALAPGSVTKSTPLSLWSASCHAGHANCCDALCQVILTECSAGGSHELRLKRPGQQPAPLQVQHERHP